MSRLEALRRLLAKVAEEEAQKAALAQKVEQKP